jgi:HAD superfamily hydrolase (TIGR01509 family)
MEAVRRFMEPILALLFDFDGLILDTEEAVFLAWQEAFASLGLELPLEHWVTTVGTAHAGWTPLDHLKQNLNQELDWEALVRQVRKVELEKINPRPVLPGVLDYLRDARRLGLKTAVASSSSIQWVGGHLERLGLIEYFDCIRTQEDVVLTKPDPELFLSAARALGVKPEQSVVFEDSLNGILAAKRAGTWCVAVPTMVTRGLVLDLADLQLGSLSELTLEELLETLKSRTRK